MNRSLTATKTATANDTTNTPRVGDRVEFVGMCCEGASDAVGTIAEVRNGRFGVTYRVALDNGGEEWASTIDPKGTRGTGCRYV